MPRSTFSILSHVQDIWPCFSFWHLWSEKIIFKIFFFSSILCCMEIFFLHLWWRGAHERCLRYWWRLATIGRVVVITGAVMFPLFLFSSFILLSCSSSFTPLWLEYFLMFYRACVLSTEGVFISLALYLFHPLQGSVTHLNIKATVDNGETLEST